MKDYVRAQYRLKLKYPNVHDHPTEQSAKSSINEIIHEAGKRFFNCKSPTFLQQSVLKHFPVILTKIWEDNNPVFCPTAIGRSASNSSSVKKLRFPSLWSAKQSEVRTQCLRPTLENWDKICLGIHMSTVTFFSTDCNGICEVPVVNHIDILAHCQ